MANYPKLCVVVWFLLLWSAVCILHHIITDRLPCMYVLTFASSFLIPVYFFLPSSQYLHLPLFPNFDRLAIWFLFLQNSDWLNYYVLISIGYIPSRHFSRRVMHAWIFAYRDKRKTFVWVIHVNGFFVLFLLHFWWVSIFCHRQIIEKDRINWCNYVILKFLYLRKTNEYRYRSCCETAVEC